MIASFHGDERCKIDGAQVDLLQCFRAAEARHRMPGLESPQEAPSAHCMACEGEL